MNTMNTSMARKARFCILGKQVLIVLFSAWLIGCGSRNDNTNGDPQGGTRPSQQAIEFAPAGSLKEAQNIISGLSVTCAEGNSCPEGIAMIGTAGLDASGEVFAGRCTGFLIDSKTMMTNSHCISHSVKTGANTCTENLIAYFPAVGTKPASMARCKRFIFASDISQAAQKKGDYAFFEIENTNLNRDPFEVSFEGMPDSDPSIEDSKYQIPYFQYLTRTTGEIRTKSCGAMSGNGYLEQMQSVNSTQNSALRVFSPCDLPHGSSGSPIMNSRRQVVGIHFSGHSSNSLNEEANSGRNVIKVMRAFFFNVDFLEGRNWTVMPQAISTNFKCVSKWIESERPTLDECYAKSPVLQTLGFHGGVTQAVSHFLPKVKEYIRSLPPESHLFGTISPAFADIFHWGYRLIASTGMPLIIHRIPICIKDVNVWRHHYLKSDGSGLVEARIYNDITSMPIIEAGYEFDDSFRYAFYMRPYVSHFLPDSRDTRGDLAGSLILSYSPKAMAERTRGFDVALSSNIRVLTPDVNWVAFTMLSAYSPVRRLSTDDYSLLQRRLEREARTESDMNRLVRLGVHPTAAVGTASSIILISALPVCTPQTLQDSTIIVEDDYTR